MSRVCQVTGKKPMVGNNRSHAKNATRRRFLPNLQNHRFWLEEEKRFVQLRVSTKGIRIIDKKGIEVVVYEPELTEVEFFNSRVERDFSAFKKTADIILANRMVRELDDVANRVFTRDLFGAD